MTSNFLRPVAAAPAAVSTPPAPSPSRTSCSNMRRTASPVILDMKGSLPTTRMVVLPETEPATRPPKASSIDLPSTVDEIRTLREELRAEQSMIEQIHKIRRREEAYRVGSEKELCAMIKRANAEKRALEQTMSRALSRDMQKEEELREKDEQLRQKDEEIARLKLAAAAVSTPVAAPSCRRPRRRRRAATP